MKVERWQHVLAFARQRWPHVQFYREQRGLIRSMCENRRTVVVSANTMGKDFSASAVALIFFICPMMFFDEAYVQSIESIRLEKERVNSTRCTRCKEQNLRILCPDCMRLSQLMTHTRRIVTTSVDEKHLGTLWGEMSRFLMTSSEPLMETQGGPLVVNDMDIRFKDEREAKRPLNWLVGRVAKEKEGFQGYHAAYTLFMVDEASSMRDDVIEMAQTWSKKDLLFGNPRPCENAFRAAVRQGDVAT